MELDLFAGIPVRDYAEALAWYERLLGSEPSFVPHATEAVWELADHRFVFIEERPQDAGQLPGGSSRPSERRTRTVFGRRPIETRTAMSSASGVPRSRPLDELDPVAVW